MNPGNSNDNYAQIVFGWIQPAETGDYRFYLAVDDNAELYLSTDDSPANSQLIAVEDNWTGIRTFLNQEEKDNELKMVSWYTSNAVSLVAGQRYYTEMIMSEGGGGDNAAVAWSFASRCTITPCPWFSSYRRRVPVVQHLKPILESVGI